MLQISHGIFMAMIRIALVQLMGFMSLWSYQLISNIYTEEEKGSQQLIASVLVILTRNLHFMCWMRRVST